MKNYNKDEALSIIIKAAQKYDEKLKDRHFMIVFCDDNHTYSCTVGFRDMNFLHLTGVKSRLSAQQFYDACLTNKLSTKDFELDREGKVQQKLAVLPYLSELLYHNCMVGNFIENGIVIRADYFVGDTRAVISVGFREGKSVDIPGTLYKEDIRKLTFPTCKVLAIFCKSYKAEIFEKCTYLSPSCKLERLPASMKEKLDGYFAKNKERII